MPHFDAVTDLAAWVDSAGRGRRCRYRVAAIGAATLLVLSPLTIHAHDPGLSSLQVRIEEKQIVATLSLAAADMRLAAGEAAQTLDALATASASSPASTFAVEALDLRIDGHRLPAIVQHSYLAAESGMSVVVVFAMVPGTTLTVRSEVPGRLGLGHRQLMTITDDAGRPVAERMLSAQAKQFELDLRAVHSNTGTARDFLGIGVDHILGGYDHLLFLGALLLGQRRLRDVVKTVTAFTLAHSLTLGAAVLGFVDLPGWIVEPVIAASIVFVGIENLVADRDRIGSRWKLTFAFGLVHGFGFAGALQDLGVGGGASAVAARLAFFNLGVELGQVGTALVLWPLTQRLNTVSAMRFRLAPICSMLVVITGAYWLVERTLL